MKNHLLMSIRYQNQFQYHYFYGVVELRFIVLSFFLKYSMWVLLYMAVRVGKIAS